MDTNPAEQPFIVSCPHCGMYIEILSIACGIFRCGQYKINGQQLDPHYSEQRCIFVVENGMIYGCGKPFKIIDKKTPPEKCGYI